MVWSRVQVLLQALQMPSQSHPIDHLQLSPMPWNMVFWERFLWTPSILSGLGGAGQGLLSFMGHLPIISYGSRHRQATAGLCLLLFFVNGYSYWYWESWAESLLGENDLSTGRPIRSEMEKNPSRNRTRQSMSASETLSVSDKRHTERVEVLPGQRQGACSLLLGYFIGSALWWKYSVQVLGEDLVWEMERSSDIKMPPNRLGRQLSQ